MKGSGRMAFTDKQAAFNYVNQYQKENYDRITVMADKGKKAEYQAAAKSLNMSLSAFIMQCVDEKIASMK
jgi:translation elongation factor EF-Ts